MKRGDHNRLGGWPENIQLDMAIRLAAEDARIELKFGQPLLPAAKPLEPLAKKWVMLLQIGDYDYRVNDFDGLYYVWIRRDDLRARRFRQGAADLRDVMNAPVRGGAVRSRKDFCAANESSTLRA